MYVQLSVLNMMYNIEKNIQKLIPVNCYTLLYFCLYVHSLALHTPALITNNNVNNKHWKLLLS